MHILKSICACFMQINYEIYSLTSGIPGKASSIRIREEIAFTYFIDYLDDCEGGKVSLTTLQLCILMSTVINSFQLMH